MIHHGCKSSMLSHYDYIKQISLAWISPDTHWPKRELQKKKRRQPVIDQAISSSTCSKRRLDDDISSLHTSSSLTMVSATSTKCNEVNNNILHPISGKLSTRLITTVQHFPEEPTCKQKRCQLHRFARGRNGSEVMAGGVIKCSVCRVNLCLLCYNVFHKESNIVDKKDAIAKS